MVAAHHDNRRFNKQNYVCGWPNCNHELRGEVSKPRVAHLESHIPKQLYICNWCNHQESTKNKMVAHYRHCSHRRPRAISIKRKAPTTNSGAPGTKPRCNLCEQDYADGESMFHHEEVCSRIYVEDVCLEGYTVSEQYSNA